MPVCDRATIEANAKIAEQIDPTRDYFGYMVVIVDVDVINLAVTFDVDHRNDIHTIEWGKLEDMWPMCPTTFSSALPRKGDQGVLYLSKSYLQGQGITATPPKWPRVG